MKYDLNNAPNWVFEAALLLSERNHDRTEGLIDNHLAFGISKEEMAQGLSKYVEYKEAVLPEIIPIFEEYPYLDRYFQDVQLSPEEHLAVAPAVASFLGKSRKTLNKDDTDTSVNDFIIDVIDGFSERISRQKVNLDSLEDLLTYIEGKDIADETKLLLIDIYHNRYKVLQGMIELLQRCAPICEKFFPIIKDDFDKALELVNDKDNINKLLDSDASLKINLHEEIDAFVSISNFNGISLTEGIDGFVMYVGIYFFDYLRLKRENRFNDTQLINDLKALGDATRLKIVHLLREEKMYVQELANELSLTPATISHHINVLLKSELITITLDSEKPKTIYYELNNSKIDSLGNTIKSLAHNREV